MEEAEPRGALRRFMSHCGSMSDRDRRNARKANWLLFLWVVTLLPVLYMLKKEIIPPGPVAWVAASVPIGLSIVGVLAYVRFLRQADELLRKIQYEALALGFAGGFVATFAMQLLERAGLGNYGLADPLLVMVLCFLGGVVLATRRYL